MRNWTRAFALCAVVLAIPSFSAQPAEAATPAATAVQPPGQAKKAASAAGKAVEKSNLVDINSASRKELEDLPGIGKVLAPKIINGRPYANKLQLVEKNILNTVTYEKIKDLIIAKR